MSKPRRGTNLKKTKGWRGTCPNCGRTGVKLVWSKAVEGGNSLNVCKICGNK